MLWWYPGVHTESIFAYREPVDRVLSAYEFAMEVAARSAKRTFKGDPSRVCPLSFWNYLINFGRFLNLSICNAVDDWTWPSRFKGNSFMR